MTDLWTVARKELFELLGERAARRGIQVQALVLTAFLGIILPRQNAAAWLAGSPYAIITLLILPSVIAGTIGADAFAGERERKTLETLLASPLSNRAVTGGKAAAAILAAMAVAVVVLAVAVITVNVTAAAPAIFLPSPMSIGGALLGALAASCLSTSVAIALSLRTPVARAVQQMVSLMFVLPVFLIGLLLSRLGIALDWQHLYAIEGGGVLVGLAGLAITSARFHRDRLFLRR